VFVAWNSVGCEELSVLRRVPFVALCCVFPERPVRRILDRIPPLIPENVVFPEVLYFPLIPERPSLLRDLSQYSDEFWPSRRLYPGAKPGFEAKDGICLSTCP